MEELKKDVGGSETSKAELTMTIPSPVRNRENHVDDKDLVVFARRIDVLPAEMWSQRCNSLQTLISGIPTDPSSSPPAWYNSPKQLRRLAPPVSVLLQDPRSSVVKRSCESMACLFSKCQSKARYLLKDLMPAILAVQAQTFHVIQTYVHDMMVVTIPLVPCKAVMPQWLERLRKDKSRTVREACALYLCRALESWTEEGYLTPDVWEKVARSLVRSSRDPHPMVRTLAKQGFELVRDARPDIWRHAVDELDDSKLQKSLLERAALDDYALQDFLSVSSNGSSSIWTVGTEAAISTPQSIPKNVTISRTPPSASRTTSLLTPQRHSMNNMPPRSSNRKPRNLIATPPRRNGTPRQVMTASAAIQRPRVSASTPRSAASLEAKASISISSREANGMQMAWLETSRTITPVRGSSSSVFGSIKRAPDVSPLTPMLMRGEEETLSLVDDSITGATPVASPNNSFSSPTNKVLWPNEEMMAAGPSSNGTVKRAVFVPITAVVVALMVCFVGAITWPFCLLERFETPSSFLLIKKTYFSVTEHAVVQEVDQRLSLANVGETEHELRTITKVSDVVDTNEAQREQQERVNRYFVDSGVAQVEQIKVLGASSPVEVVKDHPLSRQMTMIPLKDPFSANNVLTCPVDPRYSPEAISFLRTLPLSTAPFRAAKAFRPRPRLLESPAHIFTSTLMNDRRLKREAALANGICMASNATRLTN